MKKITEEGEVYMYGNKKLRLTFHLFSSTKRRSHSGQELAMTPFSLYQIRLKCSVLGRIWVRFWEFEGNSGNHDLDRNWKSSLSSIHRADPMNLRSSHHLIVSMAWSTGKFSEADEQQLHLSFCPFTDHAASHSQNSSTSRRRWRRLHNKAMIREILGRIPVLKTLPSEIPYEHLHLDIITIMCPPGAHR